MLKSQRLNLSYCCTLLPNVNVYETPSRIPLYFSFVSLPFHKAGSSGGVFVVDLFTVRLFTVCEGVLF